MLCDDLEGRDEAGWMRGTHEKGGIHIHIQLSMQYVLSMYVVLYNTVKQLASN